MENIKKDIGRTNKMTLINEEEYVYLKETHSLHALNHLRRAISARHDWKLFR